MQLIQEGFYASIWVFSVNIYPILTMFNIN